MWYRFAVAPILLSNPIVGGFYVYVNEKNELGEIVKIPREIKEGQPLGPSKWRNLLNTSFYKIKAKNLYFLGTKNVVKPAKFKSD